MTILSVQFRRDTAAGTAALWGQRNISHANNWGLAAGVTLFIQDAAAAHGFPPGEPGEVVEMGWWFGYEWLPLEEAQDLVVMVMYCAVRFIGDPDAQAAFSQVCGES